jgi:hypothetical protein
MFASLLLAGILFMPGAASSGKSAPAMVSPKLALTTISNAAVNPSAFLVVASDPTNDPTDAAIQTVTVTWTTAGSFGGTWNLTLSAPSTFTGCSWIPVNAVTVTCSSPTGGTSPTCAGATTLSTAATQIASGTEPVLATANYSVTLNFTLKDSWKYVASSCLIPIT